MCSFGAPSHRMYIFLPDCTTHTSSHYCTLRSERMYHVVRTIVLTPVLGKVLPSHTHRCAMH